MITEIPKAEQTERTRIVVAKIENKKFTQSASKTWNDCCSILVFTA